ncbi:MAG: hypothetical protein HY823_06730 [Acidobacteria bacterium]|nr:hypothetical protein [Acidobacteriota bacterium]
MTQRSETAHLVYHAAPGDGVDEVWEESYIVWLQGALQVTPSGKLQYYKYRDRAHMVALTGKETNGWADTRGNLEFHTIWPKDNHESVHALVLNRLGFPAALFTEGMAVAHSVDLAQGWTSPRWNGEPVHSIAARVRRQGSLPSLDRMLESNGFRQYSDQFSYPLAGSFLRFLIDARGLDPLKSFFAASGYGDGSAAIRQAFQQAYGTSVDSAWADWLAFLDAQP